jgi:hypothetical protein
VLHLVNPKEGVWHIRSVASLATAPQAAHAVASLSVGPRVTPTPTHIPNQAGDPYLVTYSPPPGLGKSAEEPSIGSNWLSGAIMYLAGVESMKVTFDESKTPAKATWVDTAPNPQTGTISFDPILYTDSTTGRTFVSQLVSSAPSGTSPGVGCSLTAYTDDDGATWTPSQGCSTPAGYDHQTVGGGAYAPGVLGATYPRAVYYCSQDSYFAQCGQSTNGGQVFGPGYPIYDLTTCNGLHGHLAVAPDDGTAYVPNKDCGGKKGVAVSTDNAMHWTVHTLHDTNDRPGSDPNIGVGARGTVYMGFQDGDGHPKIAISRDHGSTWTKPFDVGQDFSIQNTQFPEVVAGDDNRAAFAFLGTSTPGDDQAPDFNGEWHMYLAMTYDGGKTWKTIDVTPFDPVQRGCIWLQGGSNTCRNLLDFNGITVDKAGRVIIGYAKGCTGDCITDPKKVTHNRLSQIARQTCGKGLFAAGDPGFTNYCPPVAAAAAPVVQASPKAPGTGLPNTTGAPAWPGFLGVAGLVATLLISLLRRRSADRIQQRPNREFGVSTPQDESAR